ncbi:low molecular weight protein tyrosine phosphatase family protein [Chitinimonas lacunae]|uniref:Low molecular weight protein tyrosine phosphatase family protein n=1 Tax=Chitinimonas lacunae TaxID=1963018 RepID=A0ABV8MSB7_9NEIS
MRVLFVCGRNRWRSPTAETVFATFPGVETASAGLANDAEVALDEELVRWAELIFVMEKSQRERLQRRFGTALGKTPLICLDIPDKYPLMDPALIKLLEARVPPYLRRAK